MLSPFDLPNKSTLLVTDELFSPADFIIHSQFASQAKNPSYKCLIVSMLPDVSRWKAIGAKSNLNIAEKVASGSIAFIDVSPLIRPSRDGTSLSRLHDLFDAVSSNLLRFDSKDSDVILDGISSLQWMGISSLDIIRFYRAIRSLCRKFDSTLFIRHHVVTPAQPDDVFRTLLQLCTYHIDVRPLASGRSGSVSGEITLHLGPSTRATQGPQGNRRWQYRLSDNSAVYFERGMAGGIL
ncbi:ELP6 family protein [Pleurotus pulmonarius]